MSKENLINRIIEDAEATALNIRTSAEQECAEKKACFLADCQQKAEAILDNARAFIPEQEQRILTVADLECRKIDLKVRKDLLSNAFEVAMQKIMDMPKEEYIGLITDMIRVQGEDGDVVIISKYDKERINETTIQDISGELGIKLSLSDQYGDFKGGVILRQNGCDKNMTIEMELAEILDKFEPKLSNRLFKDVK